MRLIDAEETKRNLANSEEVKFKYISDFNKLCAFIDSQPTVAASPWHRVEERLPEPYVQCLVRDNDNNCAVGYYRQDEKAWDSPFFGWLERDDEYYKDGDLCRIGKVVAWMPIEPPKEDA